ncbi:MAG TPA: chaperone modulator CbpM [Acidiferrobacterales bacterium]|nr:chaperone modulator CbpM [Acidiferrobacterales bacterium]
MTDKTTVIIGTVLDEETSLSFTELCRSCGLQASELVSMVEEGLLQPSGDAPENWHFPAPALRRLRTALWLQHELEINLPGAALTLSLLDELQVLRARVRALEYLLAKE